MIAVILAGGYATRLYPVAKDTAKPLLTLAGKPVIDRTMEKLDELNEVKRTIIATNARFEPQFREWLSGAPWRSVEIRVEPSHSEAEKLGAVRALSLILSEMAHDEAIVMAGDNVFTSSLREMVSHYYALEAPVVAVYDVGDPVRARQYSTVEMDARGRIIGFEEKPANPKSSLVGTCVYVLPFESLRSTEDYLREGRNPDSPGHFITWLSERRPVYGYALKGYWCDIGTPESYEEAKRRYPSAK